MVDKIAKLINRASPLDHDRVHGHLRKLKPSILRRIERVHRKHQKPKPKNSKPAD
jgi:hypothetical protein